MISSQHSLHPPVLLTDQDRATVSNALGAHGVRLSRQRSAAAQMPPPGGDAVTISLSTVALQGNFDAYINIQFGGGGTAVLQSLIVDSGNSTLIVPEWEQIQNLAGYRILGQAKEPWGCPANIVQGAIQIPTSTGQIHTIANCVFYACTGDNPDGKSGRTANFGTGCITPWSASGWATPVPGVTMQAPLSYDPTYRYAEFDYVPASSVFASIAGPHIDHDSNLILHKSRPAGYVILNTLHGKEWMSVIPKGLSIGGTSTSWPSAADNPIAMVDTGGGPVFLSDPHGYVYDANWPHAAACPTWTSTSDACNCISDSIAIVLGDANGTFSYTIDENVLPASVRGLTAVMCKTNAFMMGQQGMNIGGLSALFNSILIDYGGSQVGFKSKQPTVGV